jgi:glyoxylase-like metal-dependent hydrolase (beta-lactamase superfamily II)
MRRGVILAVLFLIGAVSIVAANFQAQAPPQLPRPKLKIERLKDNLYIIPTGSTAGSREVAFVGGNTAVWVTNTGVVVVDTKLAGWGQEILDQIKTVTDKPVTTIINTHTHNDHTGSNTEFSETVNFVTQENTKANLSRAECAPVTNCSAFKGDKTKFLPKTTFKDKMSLFSGTDRIDLYYFGAGHTNGDAWIVFPAVRIVHAGDMFPWKDAPFLDRGSGGSGVAFPATLSKAMAGIKNVDTVIGGHQVPTAWKDIADYQRFNQEILTRTQEALKRGKSVDEAVALITPQLEKYKASGLQSQRLKGAVQAIYDEINKRP